MRAILGTWSLVMDLNQEDGGVHLKPASVHVLAYRQVCVRLSGWIQSTEYALDSPVYKQGPICRVRPCEAAMQYL